MLMKPVWTAPLHTTSPLAPRAAGSAVAVHSVLFASGAVRRSSARNVAAAGDGDGLAGGAVGRLLASHIAPTAAAAAQPTHAVRARAVGVGGTATGSVRFV